MTRPKPDLNDPEYVAYATLFNDVTHSETVNYIGLSDREKIAEHLWDLGYRKQESDD